MSLLLAWIAYPLMLAAVCGGIGLLIERVTGGRAPGSLIVPLGLAGLIVVATLTTSVSAIAPATPIALLAMAAAGLAAGRARLRETRVELPTLLLALAVFCVFAAPVALSGEATFAGYGVLGDTAVQLIGIDRLLDAGHSLHGLAPSSYQAALDAYLHAGYPFGAQLAVGALHPFVGEDPAWIYQPGLAFLAAVLALSLHPLVRRVLGSAWTAAGVAFVAAQPALVYAYALQGSVKELGAAALLALLVATALALSDALRTVPGRAAAVPLAVVTAALLAVLGLAAALWVAPVLLVAFVLLLRERDRRSLLAVQALVFAAVALVLSAPALAELRGYFDVTTGVVTADSELGNLLGRLRPAQALGIWINGDYRLLPAGHWLPITRALIALAVVGALAGCVVAIRRRAWAVLLYAGVALLGSAVVARTGSPWAEAKAFMIGSPALLLLALLGPAALATRPEPSDARAASRGPLALVRPPAVALLAALATGVLLSNALAYRDVSLAPRDRLVELQQVGERFGGRGPLLQTEFEEFGKHFLRQTDPSGVSESYSPRPADPAPPGKSGPRFGYPSDLDALALPYVQAYRLLLLRRSPVASRPPADYARIWRGRWYELWERRPGPQVLAHLPLGAAGRSPSSEPRCTAVRASARKALRMGARLAYVPRPVPPAFLPTRAPERPAGWEVDGGEPLVLRVNGGGRVDGAVAVPRAGRYDVWVGGSFGSRPLAVALDGREVGSMSRQLDGRGQYERLGTATLAPGMHVVTLSRGGRTLAPGGGGGRVGPLVLTPASEAPPAVRTLPPGAWRTLCGRELDWIELVRS